MGSGSNPESIAARDRSELSQIHKFSNGFNEPTVFANERHWNVGSTFSSNMDLI